VAALIAYFVLRGGDSSADKEKAPATEKAPAAEKAPATEKAP
jgi:hypothetical protein